MDNRKPSASVASQTTPCFPERLRNVKFALFLLCISVATQSMMVTGSLTVSLNSIERAFRYNSFKVAFIDTTYNLGFAFSALLIGIIVRGKKMRWIGGGLLLMAIGCLVFSLPVFIKGSLDGRFLRPLVCLLSEYHPNDNCVYTPTLYLFMMCFAYFLIGVGAAPLHTLAVKYLNEHMTDQESGLYTGIYYTAAALGPSISFNLYYLIAKIPVLPKDPYLTNLSPDSENWIGAYWIIYLIGMTIFFAVAIPVLLLPSDIRTVNFGSETMQIASTNEEPVSTNMIAVSFVKNVKSVLSNKTYVLICFAMLFDGVMSNAIGIFTSKYIESQYKVTTGKAALYGGSILVVGAAVGLLLGGLIIRFFHLPPKKLARGIALFSFLGAISLGFIFFRCPTSKIEGIEISNQRVVNFTRGCSKECNCEDTQYFPICVGGLETYFSPCVLGCKQYSGDAGNLEFQDCVCMVDHLMGSSVIQGTCPNECGTLVFFLLLGFLSLVIEFVIYIPQINLTMRVLTKESGLLGLSIQQILVRFAFLLGPLIYGPLLDKACLLINSTGECDVSSNCLNYDLVKLSYYYALPSILFKLLATLCLVAAQFCIRTTS